ncbi:helix-turn-helix transcriptional regulator [Paenibacillus graminis]|uniref:helix-turn-helix domain-containing protein n=1 Tax=Paenibacillus graminis TaxID=189425 RepID=UPI002DB598C4|nr:helix-turn-helix transcriptional regulator [Paenibacillus graminis]MEC0167911.1 helix-turn-helix transcriptional regulator [Paenibacillus graminis]
MYVVGECRLRALLKDRKLSQAELGRRTGISRSQIGHWINDRKRVGVMGLDKARTIAEVLGLDSPYEIYEWDEIVPDKAASE